jgi:hypothetical protein
VGGAGVTGILAAGLGAPAGVITAWVIALLSVTAAALVTVGLARAWRGRRRPQVVIHDVELDEVPAEAVAGLSVQLREKVRRELRQHFDDATHAEMETVAKDVAAGLVTVRGGSIRMAAVAQLNRTTSDSKATLSALGRTTSDSKDALSAGLRAVAPNEAEGLAVALDLALPAQRGWGVRCFPIIRGYGAKAEVGLSVEVAPLGGAPDAFTTFWETSAALQRPESDAAMLAVTRDLLHKLLRPASEWIAMQLVARHLELIPDRPHGLPLVRRSTREMTGLQLQLAGQMSLYVPPWAQRDSGAGFMEQALRALDRAAELLPQYYRPRLTKAAIYEHQGWSQRQSDEGARAHNSFMLAVEAFDQAEKLLQACGGEADTEKRDDAIERLAVRRTKCRLLSGDRAQATIALQELAGYTQLRDSRPVQLYNAACLFAVAMACPHVPDDQRTSSEWRAWHYLGRALVLGGEDSTPWSKMTKDEELAALDEGRRLELRTELQKRHDGHSPLTDDEASPIVLGALEVLGLANPLP